MRICTLISWQPSGDSAIFRRSWESQTLKIWCAPCRCCRVLTASACACVPGDPFAKLLGTDWQKTHWFFTAAERDRVLEDMSRKHEYSRIGDQPALVFEKVEKLGESRNF